MNCTHAAELLPLYIAGDLPPAKAEPIARHLNDCPSCRLLASEFAAGREWLQERATPAFDEELYDDLRAGVWNRIDAEAAQPKFSFLLPQWSWRPMTAMAAAALLLAVFAVIALRRGADSQLAMVPPPPVAKAIPTPTPEAVRVVTLPKTRRPQPRRTAPAIPLQVAPEHRPALGSTAAAPPDGEESEMMRIEIQTADPNIRIIWLTPKVSTTKIEPMTSTTE